MKITHRDQPDYEQFVQAKDETSGLNATICIHRTIQGRAAGGCRLWAYQSEAEMQDDAMRLAKTMTYKAVFSNVPLGGAKAIIIGNPQKDKTPALYRAMGKFVDTFQGQFFTGKDVGTTLDDVDYMKESTPYVMDRHFISGNSSLFTAYGIYQGLKAALKVKKIDLQDCRISLQGAGAVVRYLLTGFPKETFYEPGITQFPGLAHLCKQIILCDVYPEPLIQLQTRLQENGVSTDKITIVEPEAIYYQEAEIFMPCALGNVLTLDKIEILSHSKVRIVGGCANSQLPAPKDGIDHYSIADQALHDTGILYIPDYGLNVGGLAIVSYDLQKHLAKEAFALEEALTELNKIYNRLLVIFQRSQKYGTPTASIADRITEEKLKKLKLENRGAT